MRSIKGQLMIVGAFLFTIKSLAFQFSPRTIKDDVIYINDNTSFGEQMIKENTAYVIQSSIDLKGDTILIPKNCRLAFYGGVLKNGGIKGENTSISSSEKQIFENVVITGLWNNAKVYPEWFGAKGDGVNDDSDAIQQAANMAFGHQLHFVPMGRYLCKKGITLKSNTEVYGNGATVIKACYPSIFRNEHYNEDIIDTNINIYGLKGETLDNNYRGLWLWLVGVNSTCIDNCSFSNNTPIDQKEQPQWCITVSGENIEISNSYINTRGGGAFSDGIHLYNSSNCKIHDCEIFTDDDCLGFCPEIPEEQRTFSKYNNPSENIEIYDNVFASKNNCIRFEIRENAPKRFYYGNVKIHDIRLGVKTLEVGSFLYIHDYRNNSTTKNSNFRIGNVFCEGYFNSLRRNFIEIYGKNPELLPTGVCNITDVSISGINVNMKGFNDFISVIGARNIELKNSTFGEASDSKTGLTIRDCLKIDVTDCHFTTHTPYTFLNIVNSSGRISNNQIIRGAFANNAGVGLSVDEYSSQMVIEGNHFTNFAIGMSDRRKQNKKEKNKFVKCNLNRKLM